MALRWQSLEGQQLAREDVRLPADTWSVLKESLTTDANT